MSPAASGAARCRLATLPRCWRCCRVARAQAEIEIEIPDVSEPIADQHSRLPQPDALRRARRRHAGNDVAPATAHRHRNARRRSSRSATTSPKSTYETAQEGDRLERHDPRQARPAGAPVGSQRSTSSGPARNERAMREVIEAQELKPGLRLNHGTLRARQRRAGARREERRLSRCAADEERAGDRSRRAARDRRRSKWTPASATLRRDRHRAGRHQRRRDAPPAAHEGGRSVHARLAAAHAVRARRQAVLLDSSTSKAATADREARTVPVTVARGAEPPASLRAPAWATARTPRCAASSPGTTAASIATAIASRSSCSARRSSRSSAARYVIPVMDVALEKLEFTADARRGRARRHRAASAPKSAPA